MSLLLLFNQPSGGAGNGSNGTAFQSFVEAGMFLGQWQLDDFLTFTTCVHDATGAAADADAVPSYAIYEDETAAAIVTGNMAKLGSVDGFYTERVQLTAASGFEIGKCYAIRIEATVGGIVAAASHVVQVGGVTSSIVEAAATAALNAYDPPTKAEMDDAFRVGFPFDPDVAGATFEDLVEASADAVLDEARGTHTGHIAEIPTTSGGLDAAEVRAAIGMASANLDTQIADVEGKVDDLEGRLTATRAGYLDNLSAGPVATQACCDDVASTVDDIYDELVLGAGLIPFEYTVLSSVDGVTPLAGVRVRVTTDAAGQAFVSENYTDALGKVVFHLDPGTYYMWRYRDLTSFVNPDIEIVS